MDINMQCIDRSLFYFASLAELNFVSVVDIGNTTHITLRMEALIPPAARNVGY